MLRISRPNARFRQWQALLRSQSKRRRTGPFLLKGVGPVSLAVEFGWPLRAMISDADRPLSRCAVEMLDRGSGERVAIAPELLREPGGKEQEAIPEPCARPMPSAVTG